MPSFRRKSSKDPCDIDNEMEESEHVKKLSTVQREASQWLFIVNDEITQHDPNSENKPAVCALRHPRTNIRCLYIFSNGDKVIHEVAQFKEDFRSWFIGETVQHDGSLYLTTAVDPLFMILPYLMKAAKMGRYMTLDQIIVDEEYTECNRLQSCCPLEELEHVCDVKGDDDLNVYRFSMDRTLSWLKLKTERVSSLLERKRVVVSGAKTSELIQSKASEEEYTRFAYGIVSDYLGSELSSSLREHLGIPAVVEKRSSDMENPAAKRAKLGDITPAEDYSKNVKSEDKSSKGKLTNAQKKLEKVDKSGMKSMMSFFSPKTNT